MRTLLSKFGHIIAVLVLAQAATAQTRLHDDPYVISQRAAVNLSPLYQSWFVGGRRFSEASSVISIYQPLAREASASLRGAMGAADGDLTSLSGFTDVQLAGDYYVESANLIFNLGIGIPSGKRNLSLAEFLSSILITNNLFRFQVPHFGTGFNVAPGVLWALPLNEDVVLGFGAGFQYRGAFNPLTNFGSYNPADEISGAAGIDIRLEETSSLSADVVFTRYGTDEIDGQPLFSPGNKILISLQFTKTFDVDDLIVRATHRTKARAEIALAGPLTPLVERVEPNQTELMCGYTLHTSEKFSIQFFAEARFFEETSAPFSGFTIVGVGVSPLLTIADQVTLPFRIKYSYGSGPGNTTLSGIEAGVGVAVSY